MKGKAYRVQVSHLMKKKIYCLNLPLTLCFNSGSLTELARSGLQLLYRSPTQSPHNSSSRSENLSSQIGLDSDARRMEFLQLHPVNIIWEQNILKDGFA
jgi:hypothetical protein